MSKMILSARLIDIDSPKGDWYHLRRNRVGCIINQASDGTIEARFGTETFILKANEYFVVGVTDDISPFAWDEPNEHSHEISPQIQ